MATLEEEIPGSEEEISSPNPLPGKLPDVKLSEHQKKELETWLREEIDRELRNRSEIEDEWTEINDLYEATEIEEKKNFPFQGAATVMIPVIPTYVEEAWAALLGIVFAPKDPFNVEPHRPEFLASKDAYRRFLTISAREELALEQGCSTLFMELCKLGTMVAKTIYTTEERTLHVYDPALKEYRPTSEILRHSPETLRVPVKDFLFPIESRSLDEARWLAHRFRLSWNRVLDRANDGRFNKDAVDEVRGHYQTTKDRVEEASDTATKTKQAHLKEHEFFEIWFEYSIKEDAEDQATAEETPVRLIATFHKESGTLMRVQHNWYPLQLHPFSICPFVPREDKLWGIGIGRMGVPFQLEVSAMHCQRLDNQTILNCVAFKYKTDSLVNPNLALTPGKGIPLDDPEKDLIPLVLGQKFDSTLQEEEHTLKFLRERIGLGRDTELGETSTNAIVRAQEARVKSNAILKNIRAFLTDIIEKATLLYAQHYPNEKIIGMLGEEDGALVVEILNRPLKDIYYGLGISVTATNSAVSKDLERQNKLSLFNLLVQYYQQAMSYFGPTQNAQVPPAMREVALDIINGLGAYVRELLDDFDIPGRDRLVVDPAKFTELAASGRSPEELARDVLDPGMEAIPSIPPARA